LIEGDFLEFIVPPGHAFEMGCSSANDCFAHIEVKINFDLTKKK
jgi:hypothetical protein